MLQYPLDELLAIVPMCLETNTLAAVLDIFVEQQCDRLIIVNSQQHPIGLLYSARLLPQLLAASADDYLLNLQQPLSQVNKSLIESIQTIPAAENLEKFSLFLKYPGTQQQRNLDWALVDSDGKYLGILDTSRLVKLLAKKKIPIGLINEEVIGKYVTDTKTPALQKSIEHTANKNQPQIHKSIVYLLAKLPWPMMLQTSQGEVVTQNLAWWQQLGALKSI